MEANDPDDPLAFDYRVKSGISSKSNALAILQMVRSASISEAAQATEC